MTIKELKKFIRSLDNDMNVYVSVVDSMKVMQVVELYVSEDGEMYIECDFV